MHFPAASLIAVAAGLIASTHAAINLGNTLENNVMWIDGKSSCTSRTISRAGENPCGRRVTLDNGQTYSVNGCGGTLYLLNGDGTFNSVCKSAQFATDCGVLRTFKCE